MKYIAWLTVLFTVLPIYGRNIDEWNKALIDTLIEEIADFDAVVQRRSIAIDTLVSRRNSLPLSMDRVMLGKALGQKYLAIDADSALLYFQLALKDARLLADDDLTTQLELYTISTLPRTGVDIEALEAFMDIDRASLSPSQRRDYWIHAAILYNNYYTSYPQGVYRPRYKESLVEALDSLSAFYPDDSPVAAFLEAQRLYFSGQENLAAANLVEILPRLSDYTRLYEVALGDLVLFYSDRPQYKAIYLNYLLRLIVYELHHDILRPEVIASVGTAMHDEGYDDVARHLISGAIKIGAASYKSTTDFDRAAYSTYLADTTKRRYRVANFVILGLAIAVAALVWYSNRLRKKVTLRDIQLKESDARIEKAVADVKNVARLVLSMAIQADERLKEYNLHALRKIKAGQMKELAQDIQSGEYLRQLNEKFFVSFDEAFLSAFPGFIDHLNALFLPEKRLNLLPGQRLSPELRIAAFMRLGVTDSSKLSGMLDLSVNTIYTYRNRLRGRAREKENFEQSIASIPLGI